MTKTRRNDKTFSSIFLQSYAKIIAVVLEVDVVAVIRSTFYFVLEADQSLQRVVINTSCISVHVMYDVVMVFY